MTDTKHKNSFLAAITYLIFFAPQFTSAKSDEFVKYHQAQAIGLLIFVLALQGFIIVFLTWIGGPRAIFLWIFRAIMVYQVVMGMLSAWRGEMKPLPWIGKYAERAAERR